MLSGIGSLLACFEFSLADLGLGPQGAAILHGREDVWEARASLFEGRCVTAAGMTAGLRKKQYFKSLRAEYFGHSRSGRGCRTGKREHSAQVLQP